MSWLLIMTEAIKALLPNAEASALSSKLISKENLPKFIDSMVTDFIVYAPTKEKNVIKISEVTNSATVLFNEKLPMIPIKKLFLPATQKLFKFSRIKGVTDSCNDLAGTELDGKVVVFGISPCDITGNNLLEEIFKEHFRDDFFMCSRERTLIIAINCLKPCYENCFCESMNSNDPKSGFDLMLTEIFENQFLAVPNSEGGKRILGMYPKLFQDPTETDFEAYTKTLEKKRQNFHKKEILVEDLANKLEDRFESDIWRKFIEECLFCGSCTFVCPTCYCFNIKDVIDIDLEHGFRQREWDSCYYPEFALVAGGHDFRKEKERRFKYRYLHKFIDLPRRYNMVGCVGCGRCIAYCPANIDIRDVLRAVGGEG